MKIPAFIYSVKVCVLKYIKPTELSCPRLLHPKEKKIKMKYTKL